jgi:hypothetical protein
MALGLNAVKASVFRRSRQQALTGPEQTTRYAGGADFGFSQLSAPARETENHPLCGWGQSVIHTKTPFLYDEVVQAHRNF